MTSEPVTCRPQDTNAQAARLLWENDCGILPVVDEQERLVGMITDRDLCMGAYTKGQAFPDLHVQESMAADVHHCSPADALEDALDLMARHQVRRLPVVDTDRRLVGILSMNDVARCVRDLRDERQRRELLVATLDTLATISEPRPPRPAKRTEPRVAV
jgi:CBS domain-containing protein